MEIARAPEVRDDERLQDFFSRASLSFNCAGMCYETQEAKDIQRRINEELESDVQGNQANSLSRTR